MSRESAPARKHGWIERSLATLDTYGVQFLILDKERDRTLQQLIRSRPGWAVDFEDTESVLFTRIQAP